MAHLLGLIISSDEAFHKQTGLLLRAGVVPVSVLGERALGDGSPPDLGVVDIRADVSAALGNIERLRAYAPAATIFAVASIADPDVIVRAMRAGANEFLIWPLAKDHFDEAVHRTAGRRQVALGPRPAATSLVFVGAKGGVGTTTMAVNCAVEIARTSNRATVIVDLKGFGEVALFLGVRARYSLLDAIDNLHRLDRQFFSGLVVKHKSGLEILAGSEHLDRPGAPDAGGIEELVRMLTRQYEYLVIDAGSHISSATVPALHASDQIFLVANPDVPSVRNAQRLLELVRKLGVPGERVRLVLNRAAEPFPISPKEIETALGCSIHHMFPSDYRTVSTALNAGVPLAASEKSKIATQFQQFVQRVLEPARVGRTRTA